MVKEKNNIHTSHEIAQKEVILELEDLSIDFKLEEGNLKAVDQVNLVLHKGETLGIVGESGCGKSVTSRAIMRLIPKTGLTCGEIRFYHDQGNFINLGQLPPNSPAIRAIRGKDISMIFQEPMTSFSPLYTIGNQIREAILLHRTQNTKEAQEIAIDMLTKVGITNAKKQIEKYPHEFSGGMRQRAMIAMALVCHPALLIADEPTTALDVTIQAQVLDLMKALQREFNMAILFITHDLGVVAEMCSRVAVMYLGKIVEVASVDDIFYQPQHPYTVGLLNSIPKIGSQKKQKLSSIEGTVPIPLDLPPQCGFFDRCKERIEGLCDCHAVPEAEIAPGHIVRCFKYPEVQEKLNRNNDNQR